MGCFLVDGNHKSSNPHAGGPAQISAMNHKMTPRNITSQAIKH